MNKKLDFIIGLVHIGNKRKLIYGRLQLNLFQPALTQKYYAKQ